MFFSLLNTIRLNFHLYEVSDLNGVKFRNGTEKSDNEWGKVMQMLVLSVRGCCCRSRRSRRRRCGCRCRCYSSHTERLDNILKIAAAWPVSYVNENVTF